MALLAVLDPVHAADIKLPLTSVAEGNFQGKHLCDSAQTQISSSSAWPPFAAWNPLSASVRCNTASQGSGVCLRHGFTSVLGRQLVITLPPRCRMRQAKNSSWEMWQVVGTILQKTCFPLCLGEMISWVWPDVLGPVVSSYQEKGSLCSSCQRTVRSLLMHFALALSGSCSATTAHKTDSCTT